MRVSLEYFSTFPLKKKKRTFFVFFFLPPPEDVQKVQAMNEGSILFGLRNGIQRWRMTRKEKNTIMQLLGAHLFQVAAEGA